MRRAAGIIERRNETGLTLVELLIALLIFALISSAGVYSLRLAIDGQAQFERFDNDIAQWETARALIRRDFVQAVYRPVRNEFGEAAPTPMIGGEPLRFLLRPEDGELPLVAFVRRGWTNPEAAEPRSTLQYVEYVLVDGRLVRRFRPYLDDATGQPRFDRTLFDELRSARIDFLFGETSTGLDWIDRWPGPGGAAGALPRAVRLTVENDRLGEVQQLFWIGDVDAGDL